ncbi:MAG: hypothetical protein KIS66_03745 [Fimbriimonadaceae bacterium]|nr:hypothetical protein [Fimbriimonadaceae bacterium]
MQRLLVLTMALEEALLSERWDEASALVRARSREIENLSGAEGGDVRALVLVREIEGRLLDTLRERRGEAIEGIRSGQNTRRALDRYRASAAVVEFEVEKSAA